MIWIELVGGLGNQLFGYALGRALQARGQEVQFDISKVRTGCGRIYLLNKLGLHLKLGFSPFDKMALETSLRFHPEILNVTGDYTLRGYWQCEKYFLDVQDQIRDEVFLDMTPHWLTSKIATEIYNAGEKSCFVHVRRTDNLRPDGLAVHGLTSADDSEYYQRAFNLMRSSVPDVRFFIFSDDPQWVKEHWGIGGHATIVDCNPMSGIVDDKHEIHDVEGGRENEDLWLMSLCRHAIIANSSFSWWGTWLNPKQEDRIVIYPDPWFATKELDSTDICPERWTKLAMR